MDYLFIMGTAVALSMDALSVSVINGFIIKKLHFKHAFRIAFSFGFFQAFMPLIGWAAGRTFSVYIEKFDHWVAFGLLLFIGAKMLWESSSMNENDECDSKNCLHLPTLLLLSIATSIDALAVGLTFAFLKISIIQPILIIGLVTFVICLVGIYIGNKIGHFFEKKLELIGGGILILIGIKIVIEHLFF